jgi:amidase
MVADDTAWLDATEQAKLVHDGEVSPLELVDAAISRIEKLNPELNAVIFERFEAAREEAINGSPGDGPLRGVPFLMKDLRQTIAGEPSSMGWKVLMEKNYRAPLTPYAAQKFIDAGLVRLGQTTVPELGSSGVSVESTAWGVTRNPWAPTRVSGGSSGGAGVAVASGMVPIAHGGDTGGSIRIPAAYCGTVGLKPSRGRTSPGPLSGEPNAGSHEEGVLTRTVRDTALALDAIAGNMPGDLFHAPAPVRPYSEEVGIDPGRLRMGFLGCAPNGLAPFTKDAEAALGLALSLLTSLGHDVEDSHPDFLDGENLYGPWSKAIGCHMAIGYSALEKMIGRKLSPEDMNPWAWRLFEDGRQTTVQEYIGYSDWRNGAMRNAAEWWEKGYDVLVTPTVSSVAPAIDEWQKGRDEASFEDALKYDFDAMGLTFPWNATGQPAISLPLYISPEGLPVGVMFVAAYGREDILLRLAAQIEQAAPWADKRPRISAGAAGL